MADTDEGMQKDVLPDETEGQAADETQSQETPEETPSEETSEESQETEEAEQEKSDSEESESQEIDEEESQRRHNAEMARRRIAEREAQRKQQLLQDQQQYVEAAETDADRLVREIQLERYASLVRANETRLLTDYERIRADKDLQIFNPDSEEFREDLYNELTDTFDKAYIRTNDYGDIIGVDGSLYDHARKWAKIWNKEAIVNQAKGQKAASKTAAKASPTGNSVPKQESKKDPLMDLLLND